MLRRDSTCRGRTPANGCYVNTPHRGEDRAKVVSGWSDDSLANRTSLTKVASSPNIQRISRMKNTKLSAYCVAIATAMMISGCAAPSKPMTPAQIENAVYWDQMAYTCVQKGYVSNLSAMARYKSNWGRVLSNHPDQAQVAAINQQNYQKYNWGAIAIQQCRTLELTSISQADAYADMQRQQEIYSRSSGVQIPTNSYQPRYRNCYTAAGMTNCVDF